jgi:hypothetical protein
MYFSDFITKPRICKSYYLSGSNDFLKEYLVEVISRLHNIGTSRVNSTAEYKRINGSMIFGNVPIFIIGKKLDVVPSSRAIKIGGDKITEKYKKAGYVEISCKSLFDNQVETLVKHFGTTLGVFNSSTSLSYVKYICHLNEYDVASCYNLVKLMYWYGPIPFEELPFIGGNLSDVEVTKSIDNFIEGKYNFVMSSIINAKVDLTQFCWALLNTITKSLSTLQLRKPTWYQKKLQTLAHSLAPLNISLILAYLFKLCNNYSLPKPKKFMQLGYLIMYLQGSYGITIGDLHKHNECYN